MNTCTSYRTPQQRESKLDYLGYEDIFTRVFVTTRIWVEHHFRYIMFDNYANGSNVSHSNFRLAWQKPCQLHQEKILFDRQSYVATCHKEKKSSKSILLSGVTVHPLSIREVFLTKFLFFDKAQKSSDVELTMAKKSVLLSTLEKTRKNTKLFPSYQLLDFFLIHKYSSTKSHIQSFKISVRL